MSVNDFAITWSAPKLCLCLLFIIIIYIRLQQTRNIRHACNQSVSIRQTAYMGPQPNQLMMELIMKHIHTALTTITMQLHIGH